MERWWFARKLKTSKMKKLIYAIWFISSAVLAQEKYITRTGTVDFEASVSSFEEVAAKSNTSSALLNATDGSFASLILVKGFRFKNALMEEHFNENYAESDKYPKATFKGKLEDFSEDKLKSQKDFFISGVLSFHGKTKQLDHVPVSLNKDKNTINMTGDFIVKVADFDIEIPKIVADKIAETVTVSFNFDLVK